MTPSSRERDVLVIGAGIGGLTAGALLARRGQEVLVLERRDVAGGCCTSLEVEGYTFDIASSLFYGFGEAGFNANRRALEELGVELELVAHDPCYEMIFEGRRIAVHQDLEAFLEELAPIFPGCLEGLRRFYEKIRPIYRDALAVGFMPVADANLLELARLAFGNPSMLVTYLPVLSRTVWSFLAPLLRDASEEERRRFKALLDVDLAFGTCTPSEALPLLLAVPVLFDRHVGGVAYPLGGAGAIPRALVRGLEAAGGELRLGATVREITVERGRAAGVVLDTGERLSARRVISNAGVWETYQRLLGPALVSRTRRRAVARLTPSFSVFVTCVGVDAGLVPSGVHPHTVVIPDHERGLADTAILYVPSLDDPSLAPEGRQAVTVITIEDHASWVRTGDDAERHRLAARRACELAEVAIPGLSSEGEVLATLSPLSLESQLRRSFGAVGGPEQTVAQSLNRRHGNRSDLEGLFLVGDSTFPGEGVVAVTISGIACADQIAPRRDQGAPAPRASSPKSL